MKIHGRWIRDKGNPKWPMSYLDQIGWERRRKERGKPTECEGEILE